MPTSPWECLDTGEMKSRGIEKLQNEELRFFVTSHQYTCHARRIVWRKTVRWEDDIKMNLLNIVWILGYLSTLLQLLHSVESDYNMIMDIRRPRSGFGRRLLCRMSRCPLHIGYQPHWALDFVKRALRQPETWCMFRSEIQTARYCEHGLLCCDAGLPRFRVSPTLLYLFMV